MVAARVCLRDETHAETETVAATGTVILPATCETVGETTYTSEAFENTAFEAQTLTLADIPALGHDWGEVTYTWSEDNTSVTAMRVCLRDETHVETETVQAAMALAAPPTETEAGQTAWSVTFQNPAFEGQSKVEADIPPLGDMNVLYLPEDLKTIGEGAFEDLACQAVIVPEGCKTIAPGAFAGCEGLIYVRLPNSLVEVAADAFEGCDMVRIDRPGDDS